jgi:hypothetical protein
MYNIFWYKSLVYGDNFGDEIVPWLLNKMLNIKIINPCHKLSKNMLLSIGSVLWACNSSTTVWGTGILYSKQKKIIAPKQICSVRGLFSRQRLIDLGYECPKNFGDPSILCSIFFKPVVNKKYTLGIIPHITEYKEINQIYQNIPNIKIINLRTNNIESVIEDILSCEQTISSALHGIIISVIYQIPTKWVVFSNKLYGDGVKYYDFFSSLDNKVFYDFDNNLFQTKNSIYNPTVVTPSTKILDIKTELYSTQNLNLEQIYESCPIKN